jgi:membrane fusion protein, multidrug efflux system
MPDGPPQAEARLPQPAPPIATPTAAAPAPPAHKLRAGLFRLVVIIAAGGLAVLFATQWDRWIGDFTRQTTDDAYVRGDVTPLSAQVDGYVRKVAVDDFQRVKAGDLLVQIDDQIYAARVA